MKNKKHQTNVESEYLDSLIKTLFEHNMSIEAIENLFPRLYEPIMNLSVTGVPARTYFYWKESGLIPENEKQGKEKGWVKINLIEYLWIKIIAILREYGVPFEKIKETKDLMFTDHINALRNEKDEYIAFLKEESNYSVSKIKAIEDVLSIQQTQTDNSPEEYKVYNTVIGSIVLELLIKRDKGYLTLAKQDENYGVGYFSIKTMSDFESYTQQLFEKPCLFIPIRSLIEEFLEDEKAEKFAEKLNLLNMKEMKVIKAIRERDFKEIRIKQDGKNDSIIIEVERDGTLLDQKAKEVKKILGLSEYSEVTLVYRNNKNLYFKNKTRI